MLLVKGLLNSLFCVMLWGYCRKLGCVVSRAVLVPGYEEGVALRDFHNRISVNARLGGVNESPCSVCC